MIAILGRLFIKNHADTADASVRRAWGTLCGVMGVVLNVLLCLGKLLAGALSGSIAITADAFNNLSDALSSVVTLLGFRLAGKKPDPDHPFGHGRMEYVSGLVVAGLILMMGVELLRTSFDKILHPEAVAFSPIAAAILIIAVLVKVYMAFYNRAVGKKIRSTAMVATARDSLCDTISTIAVLLSMVATLFTDLPLDGYVGLLVALFILYAAVQAARETISPLLGQAPDEEFVHQIEELVLSHEGVLGIHDLVVHDYGPGRRIISLHAEVSAAGNVMELHDMIDNIETELGEALHCEAVIHMDPVAADNEEVLRLRMAVTALVQAIDPQLTIHDFRVVPGPTHTNLIFDVVLPFAVDMEPEVLRHRIATAVRAMSEGNYFAVVKVERKYA
ncbi:MAG: cation transporter [Oscillospiraceae bacterium]|nr:cation transporter [Oscillospiraceae bacterium]